jgi:cytosine/adenosine deaminase-related metal-dependent hydrolase
MTAPWTISAGWIFPVETAPLERGIVTVAGDRILAVEPYGRRTPDADLGNVAVLPGFVNAHTHLDLTGLRGLVPPSSEFPAWLRGVIQNRRGLSPDDFQKAVRAGLAESLAAGTTLLGDISGQGLSWPVLAGAPLRAVVFYEVLGLPRDRARQAWADARHWVQSHSATATCRPGLSPHAPYSVRASLFRTIAAWAKRHRVPVSTHLAETSVELLLVRDRQGPFVPFLQELGVWDPDGLVKGIDALIRLHRHVPQVLFAHGNYLDAQAELPRGATVVYCPRTHAAFGHPPHPLLTGLSSPRGPRLALGTDSLASNPDLSVLAEARFLHERFPQIPGAAILRMATLSGAEALGWADETGSLVPGKSADLVVLPLPSAEDREPHRLVLQSSLPVQKVLFRGQWLYQGVPQGGLVSSLP